MSSDAWKDREKVKEDEYFQKENAQALQRLGDRKKRPSPITGEPMEQLTIQGVVVDRCPTSGGIWLDAGELEQIMQHAKGAEGPAKGFVTEFFSALFHAK